MNVVDRRRWAERNMLDVQDRVRVDAGRQSERRAEQPVIASMDGGSIRVVALDCVEVMDC